jgi:hypothetical protein
MTIAQVPVEEITARAREVKFSRFVLVTLLGFFYVLGWLAGHAWVGVVMCALAVRRGWMEGQGITEAPQRPGQLVSHGRIASSGYGAFPPLCAKPPVVA